MSDDQEALDRIAEQILALRSLEGRRCVYAEAGSVWLVRLARVESDAWGAYLHLEILPAPGFRHDVITTFRVSAAWGSLSVSNGVVQLLGIWQLLARPDLVQQITTAAAFGQTGDDLALHVYELTSGLPHRQ